jgi:hypothetical protein
VNKGGEEKIIADTCVWIEFFRKKTMISQKLKKLVAGRQVLMSGIIVYELLQGVKNKKDAENIKRGTLALGYLEVTSETWLMAGDLFFELRRKGITLPPSDVLLAALTIESQCRLFTIDRHFDQIPNLNRYQI